MLGGARAEWCLVSVRSLLSLEAGGWEKTGRGGAGGEEAGGWEKMGVGWRSIFCSFLCSPRELPERRE